MAKEKFNDMFEKADKNQQIEELLREGKLEEAKALMEEAKEKVINKDIQDKNK